MEARIVLVGDAIKYQTRAESDGHYLKCEREGRGGGVTVVAFLCVANRGRTLLAFILNICLVGKFPDGVVCT